MNKDAVYTQEQLDIALLKNNNDGILRTLNRIETEIKSNFHWTLGLVSGLYAVGLGAALCKLTGIL